MMRRHAEVLLTLGAPNVPARVPFVKMAQQQDGVGVLFFRSDRVDGVRPVELSGLYSPLGYFGHCALDLNSDVFSDMKRLWER